MMMTAIKVSWQQQGLAAVQSGLSAMLLFCPCCTCKCCTLALLHCCSVPLFTLAAILHSTVNYHNMAIQQFHSAGAWSWPFSACRFWSMHYNLHCALCSKFWLLALPLACHLRSMYCNVRRLDFPSLCVLSVLPQYFVYILDSSGMWYCSFWSEGSINSLDFNIYLWWWWWWR